MIRGSSRLEILTVFDVSSLDRCRLTKSLVVQRFTVRSRKPPRGGLVSKKECYDSVAPRGCIRTVLFARLACEHQIDGRATIGRTFTHESKYCARKHDAEYVSLFQLESAIFMPFLSHNHPNTRPGEEILARAAADGSIEEYEVI